RPRLHLEVLFPETLPDLDVLLTLERLRGSWLPADAFYGMNTMYAAPDALVLETGGGQGNNAHRDFLTDVSILGEVGREDGAVVRRLMDHLIQSAGLQLQETDYDREARLGEYIHLATQDAMHPPGRVRLLLGPRDDVRKVHAALDGQTLQVGQDLVGIAVSSDVEDARGLPGNGRPGRAQGHPAPARPCQCMLEFTS
ncbi:unnamed protein product, partial [Prorocentrum cordatum]